MPLEGDFGRLRKLTSQLRDTGIALGRVSDDVRDEVESLYFGGFGSSSDPYGGGWKPTKAGNPPLVGPTLALSNAPVTNTRSMVKIKPPRYWIFAQMGTSAAPPRRVVPEGDGSQWDGPIEAKATKRLEDHLKV